MIINHPNPRASQTMQFGVHLMVDGYYANSAAMTDKEVLRTLLETLPAEMGMHTICEPVVKEVGANCKKDPGGLSGIVMIAESHISFHTFPARGFVTIDLYTCQNDLDVEATSKRLVEAFGIVEADIYVQERGMRYPTENLPEFVTNDVPAIAA
ncbi:MAG: S-adenosylmethionine decarboxylase [Thiolinea sp.]